MKNNNHKTSIVAVEDFIFLIFLLICLFVVPQKIMNTQGVACIVASGEAILTRWDLLSINSFTFSQLNPEWVNANWLTELIMALLYRFGTYNLLLLASSIVISLSFTITYRLMHLNNKQILLNIVLLAAGFIASINYMICDHRIFSYLLIIFYVFLLDKLILKGFDKKLVSVIILLTALWANLSSDFMLGLIAILMYCFASFLTSTFSKTNGNKEIAKNFGLLFVGCGLICLLNPAGIGLYKMIGSYFLSGNFLTDGYLASPDFHKGFFVRIYELFILLLIFLSLFSACRPPLNKILLIVMFLLLSLFSAVNIPFFIILALPVIANVVQNTDLSFNSPSVRKLLNVTTSEHALSKYIAVAVIAVGFLIFTVIKPEMLTNKNFESNMYPVDAVNYLNENNLKGNVFNAIGWGCFINQKTDCKVFITGQYYTKTPDLKRNYNRIKYMYPDYQEYLDKNNVDLIFINALDQLSFALHHNFHWKEIYKDSQAIIYARNEQEAELYKE